MPSASARPWIALLPALAAAMLPAGAAGSSWLPPVEGPVTRAFDLGADPFAPGQHRGVDLVAPPGSPVRAPCSGRVAFAGAAGTSGRVVTLVCGRWRVTHLPLATIAVDPGEAAERGDALGTAARSSDHAGLHLGVRRAGDRFAYTDPLPFLGQDRLSPPPVPAPRAPRRPMAPPPTSRGRARAPDRARPPAPADRRTIARPTRSMPAVDPAPRTAPARGDGDGDGDRPPWTIAAGLLLALAAFARRPTLPRPRRRARPRTRPAPEVP